MTLRYRLASLTLVSLFAPGMACFVGCAGGGDDGFGSTKDGGPGHDATRGLADVTAPGDVSHDTATGSDTDVGIGGMDGTVLRDGAALADGGGDSTVPPSFDAAQPFDAPGFQIAVVYGQSAAVLYSVDPNTNAVTKVGVFAGCDTSGVIDIALDKSSNMYATTSEGVYTVDTSNAVCARLASGTSYPNSLSFVPAGTVDPTAEALVGYQGSTYVRINTTTGAITKIGSLGGSTYTSSGDIVSVIGGGTYLTVTGGSDCSSNDCLVEVDPTTGALIKNYGSVGHPHVYGLAFWGGNVYGFDSAGQLFEVTFPDAGALVITDIPIANRPLGLSFNGAGSTTAAPRVR